MAFSPERKRQTDFRCAIIHPTQESTSAIHAKATSGPRHCSGIGVAHATTAKHTLTMTLQELRDMREDYHKNP